MAFQINRAPSRYPSILRAGFIWNAIVSDTFLALQFSSIYLLPIYFQIAQFFQKFKPIVSHHHFACTVSVMSKIESSEESRSDQNSTKICPND